MANYWIDTAAAIEKIAASGLSREQATAIVDVFAESGSEVATKSDMNHMQETLQKDMAKQATELKFFVLKTVIGTGAGLFIALKASQYLGF